MQDTGQVSMASCTFSSASTRCCITRARLRGQQPRCCVSRRHWIKLPVSALRDGQQGQGSGLHKTQHATSHPPAPTGLRTLQKGQMLQTDTAASCCPGEQRSRLLKALGSQLVAHPYSSSIPNVFGQTLLQLRQPMHENSSTKACHPPHKLNISQHAGDTQPELPHSHTNKIAR